MVDVLFPEELIGYWQEEIEDRCLLVCGLIDDALLGGAVRHGSSKDSLRYVAEALRDETFARPADDDFSWPSFRQRLGWLSQIFFVSAEILWTCVRGRYCQEAVISEDLEAAATELELLLEDVQVLLRAFPEDERRAA